MFIIPAEQDPGKIPMPDDRQAAKNDDKGLSEFLAETFIIILSIVLVVIIVGAVTGIIPKMLQQSAFLAAKADFHTTAGGAQVISLFHQQGFAVSLNGSARQGGFHAGFVHPHRTGWRSCQRPQLPHHCRRCMAAGRYGVHIPGRGTFFYNR